MIQAGIPALAAIFAGVATLIGTGAFVPAVLVGVATGICSTVGLGVGAVGGGLLGSLFGGATGGIFGGGRGAGGGGALGAVGGVLIGSLVGAIGGAIGGYDYTRDMVDRNMIDPAPAPIHQNVAPEASSDDSASYSAPRIAAPALRAA